MPGKILSEGRTSNLPHTYRNIPHDERLQYGKNLSIVALLQLRGEATRAAYEEGYWNHIVFSNTRVIILQALLN